MKEDIDSALIKPISWHGKNDENKSNGTESGVCRGTEKSTMLDGVHALLELIKANPGCRANELAKMMGKGLRTVKRYIAALVLLKQVEFRGAPKNGGYFFIS